MYIFVMYGNVGPSWNEKRIAQAIVGHICFVDVQGTPGHRCVCLVCAYYVAVCPFAAAAMAANDREWLCNIYPPQHTHNSQAILIMREYRNLQPQPHYIPNLNGLEVHEIFLDISNVLWLRKHIWVYIVTSFACVGLGCGCSYCRYA